MDTTAIRVRNISKSFRIPHDKINTMRGVVVNVLKKRSYEIFGALDNVSFDVQKGECFGIIGRNGGGKSTLLKILAGIYEPDAGSVTIRGKISPFLELGIGFDPELSGRDNIFLNGTILGLSRRQIEECYNDIVEYSELKRFIDQKLNNYSSGMQVRLAFSVAIHANREILLLDEVLAVGDESFQKKCINEFQKHRQQGKTVILVSHNLDSILKHCDRALLIHGGKMIAIGSPHEIISLYRSQYVTSPLNGKALTA
jgi:ABC-2 type transport system ATP-binding protein